MLTLYASPGACSMAPHIALEDAGADHEVEFVRIRDGAHLTEEYRRVNARQRVPALKTDWGILTKACAILVHLGETFPEANLLPKPGSSARARKLEWMSWLAATLHATAYGAFWRPGRFHPHTELVAEGMAQQARETIGDAHAQIEKGLTGPFALGDRYTILDPYLYVFFRWSELIGFNMRVDCPRWTMWAQPMEQRRAAVAMLRSEGIAPFTPGGS